MSGGISGMMDMNMDKIFEDSVPCRVRAKRGCATHPRSIAERVFSLKFVLDDLQYQFCFYLILVLSLSFSLFILLGEKNVNK